MMPLLISYLGSVPKENIVNVNSDNGLTKKILNGIFHLSDNKKSRVTVWVMFGVISLSSFL